MTRKLAFVAMVFLTTVFSAVAAISGSELIKVEINHPREDLFILSAADKEMIKKEALKYYLAASYEIARESGDQEVINFLKEKNRELNFLKVNLDLIPNRSTDDIGLAADSYVYGIIMVKKETVLAIQRMWGLSQKTIAKRIRNQLYKEIEEIANRNKRIKNEEAFIVSSILPSVIDIIEDSKLILLVSVYKRLYLLKKKKIETAAYEFPPGSEISIFINSDRFDKWRIGREYKNQNPLRIQLNANTEVSAFLK